MINEFTGYLKFTPKYSKCDTIIRYGHWILKDVGKPYKVWTDNDMHPSGINEEICEIYKIEE